MSEATKPYPDTIAIRRLRHPAIATVDVPGSKSITNRALILAALAEGGCEVWGPLHCEDTDVMAASLRKLGIEIHDLDYTILVRRPASANLIPVNEADLFVANSGTTMRFLTAVVSLGCGRYRLDGIPRMRERPIGDLLSALRQLGGRVYSEQRDGYPPVIVEACGLEGGQVHIRGGISSQFLSGLLMAAPLARSEVEIEVEGPLVSWPYVKMTIQMMQCFGATVEVESRQRFRVPGRQTYRGPKDFRVEPDASAATYFFGAAAITKGKVTVPGLTTDSLQGDVRFTSILQDMGCQIVCEEAGICPRQQDLTVRGGFLRGIDVDMNDISDTVMTLSAVACFAEGPTTIRNVAHIRHKETDRLAALATELRRVGAEVEEFADGLKITPRPLHGAEIETYNDHRMAMSMALIGLKVPGIVIKNPGCVAKTYPRFFQDLEMLRGRTQ